MARHFLQVGIPMYFRFETRLAFPQLGKLLQPDLAEESLEWDYENVYEWMYLDLRQLAFSLNVSREHGWSDIADEILDQHENEPAGLRRIANPGPVYVMGWDRKTNEYVDDLPDDLAVWFAGKLEVDVAVFTGRPNVEVADGEPLRLVKRKIGGE